MTDTARQFNSALDAIQAVRLIREHFASTTDAADRISDVCKMLEDADANSNVVNGLRTNIAGAIRKTYISG